LLVQHSIIFVCSIKSPAVTHNCSQRRGKKPRQPQIHQTGHTGSRPHPTHQINTSRNTNTSPEKIRRCGGDAAGNVVAVWSRRHHGSVQPPKTASPIIADRENHVPRYSPMKNRKNLMTLYSMLSAGQFPARASRARSNGVRLGFRKPRRPGKCRTRKTSFGVFGKTRPVGQVQTSPAARPRAPDWHLDDVVQIRAASEQEDRDDAHAHGDFRRKSSGPLRTGCRRGTDISEFAA